MHRMFEHLLNDGGRWRDNVKGEIITTALTISKNAASWFSLYNGNVLLVTSFLGVFDFLLPCGRNDEEG